MEEGHRFEKYGEVFVSGRKLVGWFCVVCGYSMVVEDGIIEEDEFFMKENMPSCVDGSMKKIVKNGVLK